MKNGSQSNLDVEQRERQPHAVLDYNSRIDKAKKIVSIIGAERFNSAKRILEVGCGSGVISSSLAQFGGGRIEVNAVDVVDNRLETSGYSFQLVSGTELPFDADHFDIVITNHVIEHVGDEQAQLKHLREINRVLSPAGTVYFAVPNKWRLVEPHFRLPLLSWFPQAIADRYVAMTRRGTYYDCLPLSHNQALSRFNQTDFMAYDRTLEALRQTLAIEFPKSRLAKTLRTLPDWALRLSMRIMPTYIFLLQRRTP